MICYACGVTFELDHTCVVKCYICGAPYEIGHSCTEIQGTALTDIAKAFEEKMKKSNLDPSFDYNAVKDSGAREEFPTGSRRDTQEGKGRYDLISTVFLKRLAKHCENGANKYGDRNWEKGQPLQRYLNSALRHISNFLEGDRSEDHLAAAAWNLMGIIHTEEMISRNKLPKELNDLPESYQ